MTSIMFDDRVDAGRKLAAVLSPYKGGDVVVLALPRGGVVLGAEIARALDAPLDITVVRKIGHPMAPEYAVAAVAEDGHVFTNSSEVQTIDRNWFDRAVGKEQQEARRRRRLYSQNRPSALLKDKTVIIVDDGLATGLTMMAAINEIRHSHPRKVIVAIPVGAPETVRLLGRFADDVVVLHLPYDFAAIGSFYKNFDQVSDHEVITILNACPVQKESSLER